MNLVVGATGILGREICKTLLAGRKPVRALVREEASADKLGPLQRAGVERVVGDLKSPASLEGACRGVETVISTASSTLSRRPGDSIESVDLRGQLHLVNIARQAGVRHFIFVSFVQQALDFPLQTAKRAVEQELIASGMAYTIFQPTDFMEIWLSPALGFDPRNGTARILGKGDQKVSWISVKDVAAFVAGASDNAKAMNRVFPLGGPENLSPLEVVRIFEEAGAPKCHMEHVPEADLEAQLATATDPLARSFAAIMLGTARGQVASSAAAREAISATLTSVRSYASTVLGSGN